MNRAVMAFLPCYMAAISQPSIKGQSRGVRRREEETAVADREGRAADSC